MGICVVSEQSGMVASYVDQCKIGRAVEFFKRPENMGQISRRRDNKRRSAKSGCVASKDCAEQLISTQQ